MQVGVQTQMGLYELHRKESCDESEWPLRSIKVRISAEADFGGNSVTGPEQRRAVLHAIRCALQNAEEADLTILSNPITDFSGQNGTRDWEKPEDLDMRVIKSAHRIVNEIARRSQSGRVVLASELVGSIGLSAPTIGRLLRNGEKANGYLSQYVVVSQHGRTKALDLTPKGRLLASKIRAGAVPA